MNYKLDGLVYTTGNGEELRVCTKKCYIALQKAWSGSKSILWTKDGRNGPSDPVNSMSILIDWLTTEGNFSLFWGNNEGKTKLAICEEVANIMKEKGIVGKRTGKLILDKILVIEKSFKVAHDWINQTGQGVDDTEQFEQAVTKRCQFYYKLEQVMGDRAANCALVTNADLQSEQEDDNYDEEANDYSLHCQSLLHLQGKKASDDLNCHHHIAPQNVERSKVEIPMVLAWAHGTHG